LIQERRLTMRKRLGTISPLKMMWNNFQTTVVLFYTDIEFKPAFSIF
jgi:hypothetical protein